MHKTTLGKTGFSVSVLGFGTAPAAFLKAERDAASAMVNRMLDLGVNLIDTAAMYPGSEAFLGEAIGHRRGQYVLVSKCGGKIADLAGEPWTAAYITAQVERALGLLKTDAIDVMLLHSCELEVLRKGEALGALVEARDAGKIRFLGYSGDNEAAAYAAGLEDVAVIETSVNFTDQRNIDVVLPVCVENNVGVLAKRPVANAAWKELAAQPGMYKSYAKSYTERFARLGVKPADLGFAGDPAAVWPEIALRFTLAQAGVTCAIVGTTKQANFEANLAYARKGPLAAEAVAKLRAAFHAADPAGEWLGLT
jgi:aryl-alcohol dehydrogenase-like predicted oxidoreductase